MRDEDLDFAAFMEGAAGPEFAAELTAIAEGVPVDDETWLLTATPLQVRDMRLLRDAFFHVLEHNCENGFAVIMLFMSRQMERMVPFLDSVDSGDVKVPSAFADVEPSLDPESDGRHPTADEEGDEGRDAGVEGSD